MVFFVYNHRQDCRMGLRVGCAGALCGLPAGARRLKTSTTSYAFPANSENARLHGEARDAYDRGD